jgi:hypothetical protein
MFFASILYLAVFSAAAASEPASADCAEVSLLTSPVSVVARLKPSEPPFYDFTLTVTYRGQVVKLFETELFQDSGCAGAIDRLRRSVGWKDEYLFIRTECGGGNAWRCVIDDVYKLKGGTLLHVGYTCPHFSDYDSAVGVTKQEADFIDVFDALENESCHACAPDLKLILHDRHDHLILSVRDTWRANHERFENNDRLICQSLSSPDAFNDLNFNAALLFNFALSKLCMHHRTTERYLRLARKYGGASNEDYLRSLLPRIPDGNAYHQEEEREE